MNEYFYLVVENYYNEITDESDYEDDAIARAKTNRESDPDSDWAVYKCIRIDF
jgi:hypothetical protein